MTENDALQERIAAELIAARARTAALTSAVDEADLVKQHSPLMSPLVWDLAHIANQEELWLLREVGGRDPLHPEIDPIYDAFEHPRAERPTLPLLAPEEARGYSREVRGRVLDLIDRTRPGGRPGPFGESLTANAFAFGMVAQHEVQHDETMLATHQLRVGPPVLSAPPPPPAPADAAALPAEVHVAGGPFTMGTSSEPWALDNERPAHEVDVAGFYLDTTPVTNAAYAEFIADGGYDDPRFWTAEGWAHRQRAGLTAPLFWRWEGEWVRVAFGRTEPIAPSEPVMHVCWYEADAYARWAGRRLPTEAEWEKAARHDPAAGRSRRYPWGDAPWSPELANLGQRHLRRPRRAATRPAPPRAGRASSSATSGSGRARTSALPGVRGVAVQGVLRGVLRPGVQGAARRRVRRLGRRLPGHVQELGLPDQAADLRRLPDRAFRAVRHSALRAGDGLDVPPPRLPGTARPAAVGADRPPARAVPAGVGAAAAAARDRQRRRVRRRLGRRRRPGARAVPARDADLGRPLAAGPRPRHPVGGGAGGGPRRHPGDGCSATRRRPRSPSDQWLFSHNGSTGGLAGLGRGARLPGRHRPCSRSRRWCTPRSCGRWSWEWLQAGAAMEDGPRRHHRRLSRRAAVLAGSTSWSPTGRRSRPPPGATRSGTRRSAESRRGPGV